MKSFNWFSPCFKYPYRHDSANAFIFAVAVLAVKGNMEYCKQSAESDKMDGLCNM